MVIYLDKQNVAIIPLETVVIALINNALLTHDNMPFNNMLSNFLCSIFLHIKLVELEDGVNVCFIFSG